MTANSTTGPSTITFNIPGQGPFTIKPTSALPPITNAVTIDGYSQPGASQNTNSLTDPNGDNAKIMIEIDGSQLSSQNNSSGFVITPSGNSSPDGTVIEGLSILGFPIDGIHIINSNNNKIMGNFIGVPATGTTLDPNTVYTSGNRLRGVEINDGNNNVIGGATPSDPSGRNVITGNAQTGVFVTKLNTSGTTGNIVQGNYIGVDVSGSDQTSTQAGFLPLGLGNGLFGISYQNATSGMISGNVVSGNSDNGIRLLNSSNFSIQGNIVGLQNDAKVALPNRGDGVDIENGSDVQIGSQIGSIADSSGRNIIGGNLGNGIQSPKLRASRSRAMISESSRLSLTVVRWYLRTVWVTIRTAS